MRKRGKRGKKIPGDLLMTIVDSFSSKSSANDALVIIVAIIIREINDNRQPLLQWQEQQNDKTIITQRYFNFTTYVSASQQPQHKQTNKQQN